MTRVAGRQRRQRGSIDVLPSGALRIRVYAGVDPVTRRRHDLIEIIPAGPGAERRAEDARVRLLAEVQQRRNPRTSATVDQLLDQYLTRGCCVTRSRGRRDRYSRLSDCQAELVKGSRDP